MSTPHVRPCPALPGSARIRGAALVVVCAAACFGPALLAALPPPDPDNGGLTLPPGFRALVVADDLIAGRKINNSTDQLRFLAAAPNGDLYAQTFRGGLLALRDTDGDGRFDERHEFGAGGGTGIALRGDWLYFSSTTDVFRYRLTPGQLVPAGAPERIVTGLPDRRQHEAKAFAFGGDGQLYVEVGSPSNAHGNPDRAYMAPGTPPADPTEFLQQHGGFWRFDPDRRDQTQADGHHFSTGHRHVLAIAWQPRAPAFFVVQMGRDQLNVVSPENYDDLDNAERVAEVMHKLTPGADLGWPFTYWDPIKRARMMAPEFGGDGRKRAAPGRWPDPVVAFPAHWAPLQMAFYTAAQFPAKYQGGAFVAFHGSWNRAPLPQDGFNLSFAPFDEQGEARGSYEVFAANAAGGPRYRMGGVAVAPDGSLFLSETDLGRIWRIFHSGETATGPTATKPVVATATPAARPATTTAHPAAAPITPVTLNARGQQLYTQVCAVCHMADGAGAGAMQPSLVGSRVIAGDTAQLLDLLLHGSAATSLPADRPKYSNLMPGYAFLEDAPLADLATYLRQCFAPGAPAVDAAQIGAARRQP